MTSLNNPRTTARSQEEWIDSYLAKSSAWQQLQSSNPTVEGILSGKLIIETRLGKK